MIGLHNGYWLGTDKQELYDSMAMTKATGVDVYEMETWLLLDMKKQELINLKKRANDLGLQLNSNGGFNSTNDISADDVAIRRKGIEMAKKVIKAMSMVGIPNWSGINYSAWLRKPKGVLTVEEKRRVWELSIQSLREIVKIAEDYGVMYCLEVVNRFEQFLVNTAQEGVALVEEVGSPNVKLLLDTFHMNIEEDNIANAIVFTAEHGRLGQMHVSESNRRVIGSPNSHMNWDEIFGALNQVKFDGIITMEPFVIMGIPIASEICVWRDLSNKATLEKLVQDARNGANFIREHIKQ